MTSPSIRLLSFTRAYFEEEFRFAPIVDVPDDQGLLQTGMIVGKEENGVLVDFFCKGQVPRFVEYGKVFFWDRDRDFLDPVDRSRPIQALLRVSNDRPFSWYPCDYVDISTSLHHSDGLVSVKLKLEGAVMKEIVHTSQIRNIPINMELRSISVENYFETRSYRMPEPHASLSDSSPLWKMSYREIQRTVGPAAMHLCHGNLEYLSDRRLDPLRLKEILDWTAQRMENCLRKGLIWSDGFFAGSPVTVLPDDGSASVPFRCLPVDILVEIFQFLESIDRVWLRRVSPQWNGILSMEGVFKDGLVALKYRYDCPFKWSVWDTRHAVILILTKLVTKTTKWVIIVGSKDNHEPTTGDQFVNCGLLGLIADTARYFNLLCAGKLTFIISELRWCIGFCPSLEEGVEKMASYCTDLTSVCDTLVWKNCTFVEYSPSEDAVLTICRAAVKVASATLKADLWEMLDLSAPETNLQELAQWFTREISTERVLSILSKFQTGHPCITAKSTLYHSDELKHVEVGKLDVRRLSSLAQWKLSVEMAKVKRLWGIYWENDYSSP